MASGEISSRRWVSRWSELLPDELLDLIVKKLTRASDYLRFRCVCKSWRSVAEPTNLPPHLPLLMLHYEPHAERRYVLSLPTWKTCALFMPNLVDKVILASSRGWLLLLDLAPAGGRLFLLNPLTGAQIQLPPTDGFVHLTGFEYCPVRHQFVSIRRGLGSSMSSDEYSVIFPWRAFLLLSPNLDPRDSVVVIAGCCSDFRKIAFCKLGDESWTMMNTGLLSMPVSVGHREGRLFMSDKRNNVSVCKIASPSNPELFHLRNRDPEVWHAYFATTSTQRLLLIYQHVALAPHNADCDDAHINRCFGIFESKQENTPGWCMAEFIHDSEVHRSLKRDRSFLIFHRDIPGRRGSWMFYSRASGVSYRQLKSNFHEINALDFETGKYNTMACTCRNLSSKMCLPPVWIELNLCKMLEQSPVKNLQKLEPRCSRQVKLKPRKRQHLLK